MIHRPAATVALSVRRLTSQMSSLAADICTAVGALALLAFVLLSTMRINQNRKIRDHSRKLTSRILNWK